MLDVLVEKRAIATKTPKKILGREAPGGGIPGGGDGGQDSSPGKGGSATGKGGAAPVGGGGGTHPVDGEGGGGLGEGGRGPGEGGEGGLAFVQRFTGGECREGGGRTGRCAAGRI